MMHQLQNVPLGKGREFFKKRLEAHIKVPDLQKKQMTNCVLSADFDVDSLWNYREITFEKSRIKYSRTQTIFGYSMICIIDSV